MLEQILRRINDKGWNVYGSGSEEGLQESIPRGPARELEVGKQYVLFPIINEPRSFGEARKAMERMRHERAYPLIRQGTSTIPLALIINEKDITARGQYDFQIGYQGFLTALDGLKRVQYYNS